MDDMIVKTKSNIYHVVNLTEVFSEVRKHNMILNPEKCTFDVRDGKFLGFYLSEQGIEANPHKCREVTNIRPPTTKKEIQKLNTMITALS